jgi:hypothetical protein
MGRNYISFAVMRTVTNDEIVLLRYGFIELPDIGDTKHFGTNLLVWRHFFEWFVRFDVRPDVICAERFTYRPGTGQAAEEINLFLAQMAGLNTHFVRNTDWKGWLKKTIKTDNWQKYFGTPTPHEADAIGLAAYGWFMRHLEPPAKKKKASKKKVKAHV